MLKKWWNNIIEKLFGKRCKCDEESNNPGA